MSLVTDINKLIEADTATCVEDKYSFWKFKPRRHYEPACRSAAQAKYADQLNYAYNVNLDNELTINEAITGTLGNGNNWTTYIVIALFIIIIFSTIL